MSSLCSVIIPTRRRAELLRLTTTSVLEQTHFDLEVLVVDDSGDASTRELMQAQGRVDRRLTYILRHEHSAAPGAQASRNVGLRFARGDFILFLDDDDLLGPTCLENRVKALLAKPALDYCVGQCVQFENYPYLAEPLWLTWSHDQDDLLLFLSNKVPWQTSGPLWRRSALEKLGDWDESLIAGHDYEFHIRALAANLNYLRIDEVDYFWRCPRADSLSSFEASKTHHRDGSHILAFCRAIDWVGTQQRWKTCLRKAAWREAVRLAALCRLHGGTRNVAQSSLDGAHRWECGSMREYVEASACIATWARAFGKVPALTYLARRNLI